MAIETEKLRRLSIALPMDAIATFCERWKVREFALFGSVLREDFRPAESDIDVLVTLEDPATVSLFDLVEMEQQLQAIFARRVDMVERGGVEQNPNPFVRIPILETVRVVYAR
ncbi:MAG: polymerase beta domain protein region [Phycisphaerales bacterium]|nr:polymerase beta domain protein region [Phycisphaerales bacterium]